MKDTTNNAHIITSTTNKFHMYFIINYFKIIFCSDLLHKSTYSALFNTMKVVVMVVLYDLFLINI